MELTHISHIPNHQIIPMSLEVVVGCVCLCLSILLLLATYIMLPVREVSLPHQVFVFFQKLS
jgi:hypothetical protein